MMSRVTTKVTDLESLKRAKTELATHLDVKKISIQFELSELKNSLIPTTGLFPEENEKETSASKSTAKMISRLIVKNLIKPKSKMISKISIFLGTYVIEKYGGNLQQTVAKWILKKDQPVINE